VPLQQATEEKDSSSDDLTSLSPQELETVPVMRQVDTSSDEIHELPGYEARHTVNDPTR